MAADVYSYLAAAGGTTAPAPAGNSINYLRSTLNFGDRIHELEPQESIFFAHLNKFRKIPTPVPIWKFMEQRHQWQRRDFLLTDAVTSAVYTSGTTILDTSTASVHCLYDRFGREQTAAYTPEFFIAGQIVAIQDTAGTARRFRINATPNPTSGAGSLEVAMTALFSATTAFAVDAKAQIIGSAFAEGTDTPDGWRDELYDRDGYTQIFKTAVPIMSGTAMATEFRGKKNEWARVLAEKMKEHKQDLERAALFGYGTAGGGASVQYSWGILPYTELYGKNYTLNYGDFDYNDFMDIMQDFFDKRIGNNHRNKLVLCSAKVMNYLNRIGKASPGFLNNSFGSDAYRLDVQAVQGSFGQDVMKIHTVFGDLHFTESPQLESLWEDYCIAVDLGNVAWRPLNGNGISRDTHLNQNVQDRGLDGRQDELLTEAGLEISLPETHAVIKFS